MAVEKSAKKRGQPVKRPVRSPVIAGRVPASLHQRIKDAAGKSGRSMSEEMAWLLGRAFEWQEAFGDAQKILANAKQVTAAELQARLRRDGWTPVTGIGGAAWFEPGTDHQQWFAANTSQNLVEEIAERAAIRAIQKVTDNAR